MTKTKNNRFTRSTISKTVKTSLDKTKSLDGQPEHLSWVGYVFAIILGLCMAFVSGYSNGVSLSGFLGVGKQNNIRSPVAGVTNEFTQSAISLLKGDFVEYRFHVGTILSVMVGSCLSAVMNPRPVPFIISPRYGPSFLIGSLFAALGAVESLHNTRREFFFVAVGNGIMNGITSMYSANLIRVSSFSGPVTDIGIYIGQWLRGNRSNNWRLYTLSGLASFFFIGGLVGYEAAVRKKQEALIFNAVFFFAIGVTAVLYFVIHVKLSLFEALFGITKMGIRFKRVEIMKKTTDSEGNNVGTSMHESELLMAIYDELLEREGQVNEDTLMSLVASRDLEMKRHRRSIIGIIHERFGEHDQEGDFTITKHDWKRLVAKSGDKEDSKRKSISSITRRDSGVNASIQALQQASIRQIESTGWLAQIEEENGEE